MKQSKGQHGKVKPVLECALYIPRNPRLSQQQLFGGGGMQSTATPQHTVFLQSGPLSELSYPLFLLLPANHTL